MIRGFMKTTSRTALLAAAGILMGTYAYAPAKAADLGGGCCADLEERVAELEATTARKGNRVVSLQIYGQVNKALMFWDDGFDSDVFVVDNDYSSTRLGFTGKAHMREGWTAGYMIELDIQDAASNRVTNPDGDDLIHDEILIRHSYLYFESERLGRFTLGHTAMATDGITTINLGNPLTDGGMAWATAFDIRINTGVASGITWGSAVSHLGGGREDIIRYDSPTLHGFILSASWGENDMGDVTLRFKREWNSIRLAAGIGYLWASDNGADYETLGGSISVMHVPTGLYIAFGAAERDWEFFTEDASHWYINAGVERKWLPHGSTTFYGEYGSYDGINTAVLGDEVDRWGLGIVQRYDSAAMEIYAQAAFWDFNDASAVVYEDLTTIMLGSRIKF